MATWYWIVVLVVSLPIIWFLLKLLTAIVVPPDRSGRELLKQKLKARGVDVGRIPDSALNEIVGKKIRIAKGMASLTSSAQYKNWRANLVDSLDTEAALIAEIMSGRGNESWDGPTRETLIKFGVLRK